jgi:hypothetical protein
MNKLFNEIKRIIQNDLKLSFIFFGVLFFYVLYLYYLDGHLFIYINGWYYNSIANSILAGQGYANPFDAHTGPTAWIPPLLVYIFVIIYKIMGNNFASHFFIMFLQISGISFGFYYLLKAWSITNFKKNNFIVFAIYLYLIFVHPMQIFRMLNDLWLYLMISCFLIYGLVNYIKNGKSFIMLIILSVLIPFASPIFALSFVIILSLLFISDFGHKFNIKFLKIFSEFPKPRFVQIFIIGLAFGLCVSIWTIRNYMAFDKFIVAKSNQWYEFYLCNVVDEDGILSNATIEKYHVDKNQDKFKDEILAKNEVGWLKQYDSISHEYLKNNKADYLKKVLTRCYNSLIFTVEDNNAVDTKIGWTMPDSDQVKLKENLIIKDTLWLCMDQSPLVVYKRLSKLFPNDAGKLYENWKYCKVEHNKAIYSKRHIVAGLIMGLLSLLSILFLLIFVRKKDKAFIYTISITYIIYLIPYILISHELRYQQPLYAFHSLLISVVGVILFNQLFDFIKKKKKI